MTSQEARAQGVASAALQGSPDKIRQDREDRGAEQLTPEGRRELAERAEALRRSLTDTDVRMQELQAKRVQQEVEVAALEQRIASATGGAPHISDIVRGENDTLKEILSKEEERLRLQIGVAESSAASSGFVYFELPHTPKSDVEETSRELLPDLTTEGAEVRSKKTALETPIPPEDFSPPSREEARKLKASLDETVRLHPALEGTEFVAEIPSEQFRAEISVLERNFRRDPQFNELRNDVALHYLNKNGDEAFKRDYTGAMDAQGWLIKKHPKALAAHVTGYDLNFNSHFEINRAAVEAYLRSITGDKIDISAARSSEPADEAVEAEVEVANGLGSEAFSPLTKQDAWGLHDTLVDTARLNPGRYDSFSGLEIPSPTLRKLVLELENSFEKDPKFKQIRNEVALQHLNENGDEAFRRDYTGEMDAQGWLIKKDPKAITTHVTGYDLTMNTPFEISKAAVEAYLRSITGDAITTNPGSGLIKRTASRGTPFASV